VSSSFFVLLPLVSSSFFPLLLFFFLLRFVFSPLPFLLLLHVLFLLFVSFPVQFWPSLLRVSSSSLPRFSLLPSFFVPLRLHELLQLPLLFFFLPLHVSSLLPFLLLLFFSFPLQVSWSRLVLASSSPLLF
jgi:hypothetical protein